MSLLFSPIEIGNLSLKNRLVLSPMCMYEVHKQDGFPTPFHFAHYGARAIAGMGLLIQESTAVQPQGRISPQDLGIWDDAHTPALTELVDSIHYLGAKMGIQLGHAGRKALEVAHPQAPSPVAYGQPYSDSHEMTHEEIQETIQAFIQAARRAQEAGYDMIELHGAHGYLIHQFLSPLTNKRQDQYGGDLASRYLFLHQIVKGVQEVFHGSIWVRLSLTAYDQGGQDNTIQDWQEIGSWLERDGVHVLDISTGGLLPDKPNIPIHAGFQTPYAQKMKEAVSIPVATVGLITDPGHAEYILQNQQADLVLLGRRLLKDINWVNDAALQLHEKNYQVYNGSYRRMN